MQRLVYSPKVYAYVRVQNPPQGATSDVLDISPFITAGNINRVLNAVSSAQITLRNPDHKFTITEDHPNVFHPMDPITIYLSRLPNRPVQVFTGFLDEVPYLQLFPGTVTLTASCTLKRLLYTFFDPALPYMVNFMGQYGWIVDKANGQAFNPGAQVKNLKGTKGEITDGSIANLLFATLTQIGRWSDNNILIEGIPSGIADTVVKLYSALAEENKQAETEYTSLMSKMIGTGSQGTGGVGSKGFISTGELKGIQKVVPIIVQAANKYGIPPVFAIAVANAESSVGTTPDAPGNSHTGLYQQAHKGLGANGSLPASGPPYGATPNVFPTYDQTHDTGFASDLFCKVAAIVGKRNPSYLNKANWLSWAEAIQNGGAYPNWSTKVQEAQNYYDQFGSDPAPSGSKSKSKNSSNALDPSNTALRKLGDIPQGQGTGQDPNQYSLPLAQKYLKTVGDLGGTDDGVDIETAPDGAKVFSMTPGVCTAIASDSSPGGGFGPNYPVIQVTAGPLKGKYIYYGHVAKNLVNVGDKVQAGDAIAIMGHTGDAESLHKGHIEIGFSNAAGVPLNQHHGAIRATPEGAAMRKVLISLITGTSIKPVDDGNNPAANPSGQDATVLAQAKASAFATYLNFPSIEETAEAVMLQGAKSLMNDKPLLPFVEQLCQASMRSFQSLPNGDFYAFYPDWFGSFGKTAYWQIDELEILDGGIQLSDDALATHVFVVGDTIPGVPIGLPQMLMSGGVVNIFNAFQDNFIKKGSASPLANHNAAEDFLKHYGARPVFLEEAFIRSPFFEAFYAYQQFCVLWSQQFSTPFQLTFMPELYPGGLVSFQNQNLQCYIEEVTHSWDYESGFTTSVTLAAPAALSDNGSPLGEGMILAGKGGIITGDAPVVVGGKKQ